MVVAEPGRLSRAAAEGLARATEVRVPDVCLWEVAMLAGRGRIRLDRELDLWLRQALGQPRVAAAPISPAVASAVMDLERVGFHADPATG